MPISPLFIAVTEYFAPSRSSVYVFDTPPAAISAKTFVGSPLLIIVESIEAVDALNHTLRLLQSADDGRNK